MSDLSDIIADIDKIKNNFSFTQEKQTLDTISLLHQMKPPPINLPKIEIDEESTFAYQMQQQTNQIIDKSNEQLSLLSEQNQKLNDNYNKLADLYHIKEQEVHEAKAESKKAKRYNTVMLILTVISMLVAIAAWIFPDSAAFEKDNIINVTVSVSEAHESTIPHSQGFFESFWNVITDFISPIGDLFVILITLSIFGLTYISKKVTIIGFTEGHGIYDGYNISITLKNETLSDMSIKKVRLIIDDRQALTIKSYDTPFILGPLKALNFTSDSLSKNPFGKTFAFDGHNVKAEITLSDNRVIFAKLSKKLYRKPKQKRHYEHLHTLKVSDKNNELITDFMLYKITIEIDNNIVDSIIVTKNGGLQKPINGKVQLPKDCLDSKDKVKSAVENLLNDPKSNVNVIDYSLDTN